MALLGAVLVGTAGLSAGAWYGGRGAAPPPGQQAETIVAELLPGATRLEAMYARRSPYGVPLAEGDYGSWGMVNDYGPDCALTALLRRTAEAEGWQNGHAVNGRPCDGWRVDRDGLRATLTQHPTGTQLTVMATPPAALQVATAAGALLGALLGAGLFLLLARTRRQPLVLTLATVGLLPPALTTWSDLRTDGLSAPAWPIWAALAPVLVPWLLVVLVTAAFLARPAASPAHAVQDGAPGPTARTSP